MTIKKLIIFDLDGTLTVSKSAMDRDMAKLIMKLLEKKMVAVISGGRYEQFKKQFISKLHGSKALLKNLFLFPTTSTVCYRYSHGWKKVYAYTLSKSEKKSIIDAFRRALREIGYTRPKKVYGRIIEDRETQMTFSALGQKAPVKAKEQWHARHDIRQKIMRSVKKYLKGFEVHSGGLTSIDITRKGIDKEYGVRKIMKYLHVHTKDTLFVGDAIYPGGNDYAAVRTGVTCVKVSGSKETKKVIRKLLHD